MALKLELELFDYTVIPFGLVNTSASFETIIDKILRGLEYIEVHYLDDMMIHIKGILEGYCDTIERILKRFINYNLAINLFKYKFHITETTFLGFVINWRETKINLEKLDIVCY